MEKSTQILAHVNNTIAKVLLSTIEKTINNKTTVLCFPIKQCGLKK